MYKKKLYVYDFDNTIYDGDSSIDFYLFCIYKNFKLLKYIPKQIYTFFLYKLNKINKVKFKEVFFSFLNDIENINLMVVMFWEKNKNKIKPWFKVNREDTIVVSAGPKFLLDAICKKLNITTLIATEVDKNNGKFLSENCYGKEKKIFLDKIYDNYIIEEFYSDSVSDITLKIIAKKSYKVKKNRIFFWE